MKIAFYYKKDDGGGYGPNAGMELYVNGKGKISAYDGEPEDNNFNRNFSDFWCIPGLLKMAFDAGKNGEKFELTEKEMEDD